MTRRRWTSEARGAAPTRARQWGRTAALAPLGSPESIGISFFHTVGDRERAVEQLNTDVNQVYGDLFAALGWRPDHPELDESSPLYAFWVIDVQPTVVEWRKFYDDQRDSYLTRWATSWETYESWQDRVKKLRDLVRSRIGRMASAEPTSLPTTVLADATDAAKRTIEKTADVAKVVLYAGLGIGGLLTVAAVAHRMRR